MIRRINESGVTILLVEQNARRALRLARRGYVLETGRIVAAGTADALAGDETIRSAYLGMAPGSLPEIQGASRLRP